MYLLPLRFETNHFFHKFCAIRYMGLASKLGHFSAIPLKKPTLKSRIARAWCKVVKSCTAPAQKRDYEYVFMLYRGEVPHRNSMVVTLHAPWYGAHNQITMKHHTGDEGQ
jgi:hypothetical protein